MILVHVTVPQNDIEQVCYIALFMNVQYGERSTLTVSFPRSYLV